MTDDGQTDTAKRMRILIVKLSSLGDVVHAMPAVQDMRLALQAQEGEDGEEPVIDWVVERGFAPLVRRCAGVQRTIESDIRNWRKTPWRAQTRQAFKAFLAKLREHAYDAVIDLQGLTKSALVARLARLSAEGKRYGLANATEGSSHEAPARWLVDVAIRIEPRTHVVSRSRELCARALNYSLPSTQVYGLQMRTDAESGQSEPFENGSGDGTALRRPLVVLVHGSSRADKLWPEAHWVELGKRIINQGYRLALLHGSEDEQKRSQRLARALGREATVWPAMELDSLLDRMARSNGVIGVDSGLSHIAVALDLPHVQIYNFDTAWRTGPQGVEHQLSVVAQPTPTVDEVWQLWQQVLHT